MIDGRAWKSPLYRLHYAQEVRRIERLEFICIYCRLLNQTCPEEYDRLTEGFIEVKQHDIKYIKLHGNYELFTLALSLLWDELCDDIFGLLVTKDQVANGECNSSVSSEDFEIEIAKFDKNYSDLKRKNPDRSRFECLEQLLADQNVEPPNSKEESIIEPYCTYLVKLSEVRNALVHRKGRIAPKDLNENLDLVEVGSHFTTNVSEFTSYWNAVDKYHCIVYTRICRTIEVDPWMQTEKRKVDGVLTQLSEFFKGQWASE